MDLSLSLSLTLEMMWMVCMCKLCNGIHASMRRRWCTGASRDVWYFHFAAQVCRAPLRCVLFVLVWPEGTKHATSVNLQLPCLQKDLRSWSRTFGAAWYGLAGRAGDISFSWPWAPAESEAAVASRAKAEHASAAIQSYISKGIWRQGIGSFVRNSYVSTLCHLVICPYLRTSKLRRPLADLQRQSKSYEFPCRRKRTCKHHCGSSSQRWDEHKKWRELANTVADLLPRSFEVDASAAPEAFGVSAARRVPAESGFALAPEFSEHFGSPRPRRRKGSWSRSSTRTSRRTRGTHR